MLLGACALIAPLAVMLVYQQHVSALNRGEMSAHLEQLRTDLVNQDNIWDKAADQVVSIIEWSGLVDASQPERDARLTAFFIANSVASSFSGATLTRSSDGKVLFEYWADNPPTFGSTVTASVTLWLDPHQNTLYSSYAKVLHAQSQGLTLILYRPWDNATLKSVGDPAVTKFMLLDRKPLLSSDGPLSLQTLHAGTDDYQEFVARDARRHQQGFTYKKVTDSRGQQLPVRFVIQSAVEYVVPVMVVIGFSAGLCALFGVLLFMTVGRWLGRVGVRVDYMAKAAALFQFGDRPHFSKEIRQLLQTAEGKKNDQIGAVSRELGCLMEMAESHDVTQKTYLHTIELLQNAVIECTPDGKILRATYAWNRMAGLEDSELGKFSEVVAQSDQSILFEQLRLLMAEHLPQVTCRFRLKQSRTGGEDRWLEGRFTQQNAHIHGLLRDITHDYLQEQRIHHLALHDALTDLPNRTLLTDRFEKAIAMASRQKRQMGVCLIDLDGFKAINDNFGHQSGDRLLQEVTRRLNLVIRGEDTLARLGGDEFALLFTNVQDVDELQSAVQRILSSLSQTYDIDGHQMQISASIGVTLYPSDDADADTLLRHADQAMYQAKQAGRNRFCYFDVVLDQNIQANMRTLDRVREALRQDELRLYYQPKVNMRNGSVQGFEALLRWQHPQDGLIPPLSFLPQVEQSDVIVDIGEWVIEQALRQISSWNELGATWPVSVNIAARHFHRTDFLSRLRSILERHPTVSPKLLNIEILESVALGDIDAVSTLIRECQALGVGFSLDDFGTGYSSLSYLKILRADTLKIDQSFVRQMLTDRDDLTLVESVINIAHLFKIDVVAEGVETADHGTLLLRMGCDVAQGYGIARPMPAADTFQWARSYVPDTKWARWADVDWAWSDLPLLMAQHDHEAWVNQVLLAVEGVPLAITGEQLLDHHQCRFGHWYYGPGRERYGHLVEFTDIESVHEQVHRIGPSIIELRQNGELEQARLLCNSLLNLKQTILQRLDVLQESVITMGRSE